MQLSSAARSVWAKTNWTNPGEAPGWLPLSTHLDDAGAMAGLLWDRWLPLQVQHVIADGFAGGKEDARRLVTFLAAAHDIGKATPAFAVQAPVLAAQMRSLGLEMSVEVPREERRRLPHGLAGEAIIEDWLQVRHGWGRREAAALGVIVGGHHGVPPEPGASLTALTAPRAHLLGTGTWRQVQVELLERSAARTGAVDRLAGWRSLRLTQQAQVAVTSIVVISDWLASNTDLFPLFESGAFPDEASGQRASSAWRRVNMPAPWVATDDGATVDALLRSRFSFPAEIQARPVQRAAVDVAREMDLPGLMVIEAPMGEGKTEAALLAAEILAARSGAAGCFVALPTQATTDSMFLRVLAWLARVPDRRVASDAEVHEHAARAIYLAHGKARLNPVFRELNTPGNGVGIGDENGMGGVARHSADVYVNWWMSDARKGPLADFVVGTIDQLLFMGLKARYLALRHLAMARKVVVIDEIHAYDAYMNVYLERALEWLGAYHVPVIMLSATLPPAARLRLAQAYRSGVAAGSAPTQVDVFGRRSWKPATPGVETIDPGSSDWSAGTYPSISVLAGCVNSNWPHPRRVDGVTTGPVGLAYGQGGSWWSRSR